MEKTIYLLPGRGGRLTKGLGAELLARGYPVFRELAQNVIHVAQWVRHLRVTPGTLMPRYNHQLRKRRDYAFDLEPKGLRFSIRGGAKPNLRR